VPVETARPTVSAMPADYVITSTTTADLESAETLAKAIIDAKLGGCVQINGPLKSVYEWKGSPRLEVEYRLDIKTEGMRVAGLVSFLETNHPYELPEVVITSIAGGSQAYLDWLSDRIR
jgi:periplasmic divalent cation tolerance protein